MLDDFPVELRVALYVVPKVERAAADFPGRSGDQWARVSRLAVRGLRQGKPGALLTDVEAFDKAEDEWVVLCLERCILRNGGVKGRRSDELARL